MSLCTLLHKAGCRYGTHHTEQILLSKKISCRYKFLSQDSCESVEFSHLPVVTYCSHNVFILYSTFSFYVEDHVITILKDSSTCSHVIL